jgi:hypothetical protein
MGGSSFIRWPPGFNLGTRSSSARNERARTSTSGSSSRRDDRQQVRRFRRSGRRGATSDEDPRMRQGMRSHPRPQSTRRLFRGMEQAGSWTLRADWRASCRLPHLPSAHELGRSATATALSLQIFRVAFRTPSAGNRTIAERPMRRALGCSFPSLKPIGR